MAGLDREVGRLERTAALLVDDLEAPDDLDVVDEVGQVARPAAAVEVGHEGRSADGAEDQVAAAERDVAPRVASVERELGRRLRDELLDQPAVEPGVAPAPVDDGSGPGEHVERPVTEHLDADLAEDPERGPVDRLDLVCAEDLDRPEWVHDRPPRELAETGGGRRPRRWPMSEDTWEPSRR